MSAYMSFFTNGSGWIQDYYGTLVCDGIPLSNKTIDIYFKDGDEYKWVYNDTTSPSGNVNSGFICHYPLIKTITTSMMFTFEGDEPLNASAYDYLPNGTRYAVCTLTKFGYKPAGITISLTSEPKKRNNNHKNARNPRAVRTR